MIITTLIAWVACDGAAKKNAVYLASDSRLSWGQLGYWDLGRKIFPSEKYGDILGFCGDALFCSQQLSQIITYIDSCSSFEVVNEPLERSDLIYELIKNSFGPYPKKFALKSFTIVYLTRRAKYDFCAFSIKWSSAKGWSKEELKIGNTSSLIIWAGSGGNEYKELHANEIKHSDFGENSRGYFYALNRFIKSNKDPATGGPPQLSCLYNIGAAVKIGTVFDEERYIYGLKIPNGENINNVRWVNDTLETFDANQLKRFQNAQAQPVPRKLSGK
ncbi:hypothetical protein [Shewanella gaetbuli]